MAGPVGVVAGVERQVVAHAVTPAVDVGRLLEFSGIGLEFDLGIVQFEEKPVLKGRDPFQGAKVCLDKSRKVKGLAVELAEVVVVGIVARTEIVSDPVFVMEVDIARNTVVQKEELGRDGSCYLISGGAVKGEVQFVDVSARKIRLEEKNGHGPELVLRFFGIADNGHCGKALELIFCRIRRLFGPGNGGCQKSC